MFKNYLKIALRNLLKNRTNSFINIAGLAVGIAVFLLITMYCMNELNYNRFAKQHKNIYQVLINDKFYTMAPLGNLIKSNIPDFGTIVRVDHFLGGGKTPLIETNFDDSIKKIKMKDFVFADPTFFNVFDLPVIYGNPSTALNEPYSIVLTRSTALSIFGQENVVGQSFLYIGDRNSQPRMNLTVTAVIEDLPNNSTLSFNAVGSISTLNAVMPGRDIDNNWLNWMYATYILTKNKNVNINTCTDQVKKLWREQEKILGSSNEKIDVIPFDDVYFYNNSRRQFILFLQLVGIFILSIAVINFINLTIAKSSTRAREIGLRKVAGANRTTLIKQFLGESIFISLLAVLIALLIVGLSKPYLFKMIGKQIPFDIFYQPLFVFILIVSIVVIGIISGVYPAVVLSSFKPTSILKGEVTKGKKGNSLRHSLIVFQFIITISLIICTFLVSQQVDYFKTRDLGFNDKNVIHFNQDQQINRNYDVFKHKLLSNPNIIGVARSNVTLGRDLPIGTDTKINGLKKPYRATTVDPDFIPTMGIRMVKGRSFSWDMQSDKSDAIIVNETLVKEFGLKHPLGSNISFFGEKLTIIGVMKDFNYNSFHQKVEPAALVYHDWNSEINIRISNRDISQTLQFIKKTWDELSPEVPFEYEFLDQTYGALYTSEGQFQNVISSFSVIAIIIACLGLLGLVSHSVNGRKKEIGVRKILGASVDSIVFTLTGEFLKLIVFANVIAFPLAYYFMNNWLQDFAYHTEMNWWTFALSGGIALIIALMTISFQAVKAATAIPVESLRTE